MMGPRMGRAALLLACTAALLLPAAGSPARVGSLDLVLHASRTPTGAQLARSVTIVNQRAQLLGGSGIDVTSRGGNEIVVHVDGISDPKRAKTLLASRGLLQLYDLEAALAGRSIDAHGFPVAARRPPRTTRATAVLRCGGGTFVCPGVVGSPVKRWFYYLVKGRPPITGADLIRGQTRADTDPSTGEPVVLLRLDNRGQLAFRRVTAAEAQRGKKLWLRGGRLDATTHFQHIAIAIDRRIVSTPSVDFTQYPNGIDAANGIQITGLHGSPDAKGLALLLKSGTLPVRFTIER